MATATLQIDQTILQLLEAKATAQGVSPDVFLWQLLEGENGTASYPQAIHAEPATPQLTPYQIAKAKGLLGAVDSSIHDPDSPPIHTEFGTYLAKKHEDEKRRFFVLEEIAEKQGITPQEWVRQHCPNGKDSQGRSLSQILDSYAVAEVAR